MWRDDACVLDMLFPAKVWEVVEREIPFLITRLEPLVPPKPGVVTLPGKPNDDVAPGTLNSVLKQAGLKG
jgi:hypothetical protein